MFEYIALLYIFEEAERVLLLLLFCVCLRRVIFLYYDRIRSFEIEFLLFI